MVPRIAALLKKYFPTSISQMFSPDLKDFFQKIFYITKAT